MRHIGWGDSKSLHGDPEGKLSGEFLPDRRRSEELMNGIVSGRVNPDLLRGDLEHWGIGIARQVVEAFPEESRYTCAAGISPSGTVHFGNFRDVVTSMAVAIGLQKLGKESRLLFSWDNFDRFRKVPTGLPAVLAEHIGKPLSRVPSLDGGSVSYAHAFQRPFEDTMARLGIELEWRDQSAEYASGRYLDGIRRALYHRTLIAEILLHYMSDKSIATKNLDPRQFRQEYYPLTVYSELSGTDRTVVLDYDGDSTIVYRCLDTGREMSLDIREKPLVKLPWKVDWPMRWSAEGVAFEPGGTDHASPGSSFDSSGAIAQLVYGRRPPAFVGYEFIGLRGLEGKMSGSAGGALTPEEILRVYEPEVFLWLYLRKSPQQSFQIAFDSEVYRIYDEFDETLARSRAGSIGMSESQALEMAIGSRTLPTKRISFRQITALGQIVNWQLDKVVAMVRNLGGDETEASIKSRLERAEYWVRTHRPDECIALRDTPHTSFYAALDGESKGFIRTLVEHLSAAPRASIKEIEQLVYHIPKHPDLSKSENATRQRQFFAKLYQLLLGQETGPRLGTFLWAADRDKVLRLLTPLDAEENRSRA